MLAKIGDIRKKNQKKGYEHKVNQTKVSGWNNVIMQVFVYPCQFQGIKQHTDCIKS